MMKQLITLFGIIFSLTLCAQSENGIWAETDTLYTESYGFQVPITYVNGSHTWKGCKYCPEHSFGASGQGLPRNYDGNPVIVYARVLKLENTKNLKEAKKGFLDNSITKSSKSFKKKGRITEINFIVSNTSESIILKTRVIKKNKKRDSHFTSRYDMISYSKEHQTACVFSVTIGHKDKTFAIENNLNLMDYAKNLYRTFHWK